MKNNACSIVANGNQTDIAIKVYSNRILLIVTHFKKFGSLIAVTRGSGFHSYHNSIYSTKVLFGRDDIEIVAAARFLAEQIDIDKPLLMSLSLKDYEINTLKAIARAVQRLNVQM